MCVGTCFSLGFLGASACPSLGACTLVWSFIATSRSSSRIGGKAASSSSMDCSDVATSSSAVAGSADMLSGVGQ